MGVKITTNVYINTIKPIEYATSTFIIHFYK